jgi:hypothetical protein
VRYLLPVFIQANLSCHTGPKNTLSAEDGQALSGVLPGAKLFDADFSFYLNTAALFKTASDVDHEVLFSQLALSVAPPDQDTTPLWYTVIKGLTDLALYEDAYAALVSVPYEKLYVPLVFPSASLIFLFFQEARLCSSACIQDVRR